MCVFIPPIENSKHQHLWVTNDCHGSEDCDYCGTERLLLERDVCTNMGLFCKSAHHILVYRADILKYLFIFLMICNAVCVLYRFHFCQKGFILMLDVNLEGSDQ